MTHGAPDPSATRRAATLLWLVIGAAFVVTMVSCGASIQAVYEGDVRFEHCMAIDSRPDVKPTIPAACWEEWLKFYTFGQNRDRIDYARGRVKQLSAASDFSEGEWRSRSQAVPAAVPDPTSVLAPPPMMLMTDGGGVSDGAATHDAAVDAEPAVLPGSDCTTDCEQRLLPCRKECKTPACDKGCVSTYKRCMKRCF